LGVVERCRIGVLWHVVFGPGEQSVNFDLVAAMIF
jgi:hypothetical protein